MSFAVMPLSDYKAACDKVREKVDLTAVRFEDTDFGYIRSAVFTAKESGEYIFTVEVKDESKLNIYSIYYAVPEWEDNSSPGMFNVIDGKTLSAYFTKGETVRIFISDYNGLKASDIVFATLSHNGEVVENFVAPSKIKSGELADKVEEVYWTAANNFGLKGKGQGELVTLNNVHPIEHKVEVGLRSKNLFNEAEANITKTEDYFKSNVSYWQSPCLTIPVESGATYYFSCEIYTPNITQFNQIIAFSLSTEKTYTTAAKALAIRLKTENSTNGFSATYGTFTVPEGIEEIYFLTNADNTYFKNFMLKKGTTPTAYSPFIANFSDCKVKACGKNFFDYEDFMRRWDNGEYYMSDAATNGYFVLDVQLKPSTKYYIKANGTRGGGVVLMSTKEAVNSDADCAIGVSNTWEAEQAVTTEASGKIYIGAAVAEYVTRELFENALVQIEYGTTASPYEPYTETEYTATADGTVENVKSISPVMNLMADKAGAVIDAECFLDPQAVITNLTNTVITLGGEI